jgi:hypothetical protein
MFQIQSDLNRLLKTGNLIMTLLKIILGEIYDVNHLQIRVILYSFPQKSNAQGKKTINFQ